MNSVMRAWADLPPIYADRLMALLTAPERVATGLHAVNQLLLDADRFCEPHWLRPLRWGLLYQGSVHDPQADLFANKNASAELWREHFSAIHETVRGVSGQWEDEIAAVILASADPFSRPADFLPWQHALLDLTLGPLGLPRPLYDAYRLLIEAETAIGREAWLARASDCPRLFHTVHQDRESIARANIGRDLSSRR